MLTKSTILCITMKKNYADVYTYSGKQYKARMPLSEFEQILGDEFLKVSRSCLVSVMAIHDISNMIELTNGETLPYPPRNRNEIFKQWQEKRIRLFARLCKGDIPPEVYYYLVENGTDLHRSMTSEEFHDHIQTQYDNVMDGVC